MSYPIVDAAYVMAHLEDQGIIDVRTPDEYAQGHLPHAHLVDLSQFEGHPNAGPRLAAAVRAAGFSPTDPLIVYCRRGVRAKEACDLLAAEGFSGLSCYKGSWQDWISDPSRPIET